MTADPGGAVVEFDIARDGTLAYLRGATSSDRRVPVWVDRQGRETPLPAPPGATDIPGFHRTASGSRSIPQGGGQGDIYIWDLARPWSSALRMTVAPANDWFPVWTPNGRQVLFGSWRGGGFSNVYLKIWRMARRSA